MIDNVTRNATQLKFDIKDTSGDTIIDDLTVDFISSDPDYDPSTPVWIWADPVIFDDDAKRLFLEMPAGERPRFTTDLLEKFYAARPEYNTFARRIIYENPMALLDLFKSLTLEDLNALGVSNAESRYKQLQQRIKRAERAIEEKPIDTNKLSTIWPILSIRELFLESELSEFYYLKNPVGSAKERAKAAGAIMTIGGRLADISNKNYSGWLDEMPNKYAYISYTGNKHYFDEIQADPEGNLYESLQRFVENQDKRARQSFRRGRFVDGRPPEHERINKNVLRALLKVALENNQNNDGRYFYIHIPTFAKELNRHYKTDLDEYDEAGNLTEEAARIRAEEREEINKMREAAKDAGDDFYINDPPNFMDLITDLNYWVGMINNMPTQIIAINRVDYKTNTIRVDFPYIFDVLRSLDDKRIDDAARKEHNYLDPGYDFLLHSNIDTEKDQLAVDLAITIINHILQRGVRNDSDPIKAADADPDQEGSEQKEKIITVRVKYSDLIKETRLLDMAYKSATPKYKYDILNRRFKNAFKILKKKTDIYDYYKDLDIPTTTPTTRTIDEYLVITHKGYNPDYKRK